MGPETLVVAPNWVGDCVMAWPVLEALSRSGRPLALLARPHLHPLLGLAPGIAKLIAREPSDRETVAAIRQAACAEAVVLPNSFRSAWLPFRARLPRRWGYGGALRSPLLAPAVRRPKRRGRHQVEDYAELLAAMGVEPPGSWAPRLDLPPEVRETGRERLSRAKIAAQQGRLIGLFPGAEFGPSKRWPMPRFAELSRELRRRHPGARQVILAGPKETWLAVRLYEESGKIHPVVGPDLDLRALAGVMFHLDLLVTNDSGPMHLAAGLGVACVALFGPTDPRRTRPVGDRHRVLYTDRWCSPCFRRRCPLLHHRCLRDIQVAETLAACASLLDPHRRP